MSLWSPPPPPPTSTPPYKSAPPPLLRRFSFSRSCSIPLLRDAKRATDRQLSFTPRCSSASPSVGTNLPVVKKRKRYRKLFPGETEGITEEMRFVAMRLRNVGGKYTRKVKRSGNSSGDSGSDSGSDGEVGDVVSGEEEGGGGGGEDVEGGLSSEGGEGGETWIPNLEGFVKYLVDSKLVFDTVERIVDESSDVAYAYFTKTGLERSEGLSKDLEWFSQQNVAIPEPSNAGISYSKYLEELAEKSAPLFLSHFYNIYFSHIAGGQLIVNQVSQKILEGRDLEFCQWEGDVHESLKGVREKLNMLGEHWSRDEKNKCLKEATKSFRYMGQIVRLIIL
ncbi:probable inactive heme oxygenase 2, chloroplastic isoform X1 [Syzygium oleosum]|uniref:probable inactive heme oxygenase 2, chloroplastic isoform X1 n=1 Tax=Syzygium oleosum TaxID=219896 RepID=UPI0011D1E335|nr:probable inactive heme oxygenase 2, chloroplastic isoform X1 [Syzygium oleosum]XP_056167359.1 probable inactive heme oxygenase 2, chloroplastic isoform X1 [Syzygium oleosum]